MKCELCKTDFEISNRPKRRFCSEKCQRKSWALKNVEYHQKKSQEWSTTNKERRREITAEFRKRNPGYAAENNTLRQRAVQKAKPVWVNQSELRHIYKQAKEQGLTVDHIIPLRHPDVCGLHVPWNLQLLTRAENASKGNKLTKVEG